MLSNFLLDSKETSPLWYVINDPSFRRSMDRISPSEGGDAGSIPAGSTIIIKSSLALEFYYDCFRNRTVGANF